LKLFQCVHRLDDFLGQFQDQFPQIAKEVQPSIWDQRLVADGFPKSSSNPGALECVHLKILFYPLKTF
jgi:hypothetical protein